MSLRLQDVVNLSEYPQLFFNQVLGFSTVLMLLVASCEQASGIAILVTLADLESKEALACIAREHWHLAHNVGP